MTAGLSSKERVNIYVHRIIRSLLTGDVFTMGFKVSETI